MKSTFLIAIYTCLAVVAVSPVQAQERAFNFALRGGVAVAPAYPGSGNYRVGPNLAFTFGSLRWGGHKIGNGIGVPPKSGLALRGAIRVLGAREQADHNELAGLADIDRAIEIGLGLNYRKEKWQVFGEVRKGVTGHSGVTGTLAGEVVFRPADRWTIFAGPRVSFGDREFANTYFGVAGAEATTSQFGAYSAGGGALAVGFNVRASYRFSEVWALEGALEYEKLLNDAANSPITSVGSDDQWQLRIGLNRTFTLQF